MPRRRDPSTTDPEIVYVVDNYHPKAILAALVERLGGPLTLELLTAVLRKPKTYSVVAKRDRRR